MARPWRSPVSYDSASMAKLVEQALDASGWRFERSMRDRPFDEVLLVLMLPRTTPAHRFEVAAPGGDLIVETYDTRPTSGALVPYLEIQGGPSTPSRAEGDAQALLRQVAELAPRPPWRFSWAQRLAVGFFAPEFRRAKRAWRGIA